MLRNLSNTFFTRLVIALLNLLVAIIISNVLGADGRGEQGLILTTITLLSLITAIVGSGSITYFTPRFSIKFLMIASYVWNAIVCLILLLFSTIQSFISQDIFLHVVILGFILTASHINTGILLGIEKIIKANSIQLISTIAIVVTIAFMFFVLEIVNIKVYILALYFGYSVSFVYSLLLVFRIKEHKILQNRTTIFVSLKKFIGYGFLNQLDVLAQMLSFRFSYYLINSMLDVSQVGVYSNAVSIIESIWLISRSISLVQHARIVNSNDLNYNKRITINFFKVSTVFVLLACIVLYLIPSNFFVFIFGKDFSNVKLVIISFLPGVIVFNASFIFSALFSGMGKYKYNVVASFVGLILTVSLALLLIPRYGIIGAGISASISYLGTSVVKFIFLSKNYNISVFDLLVRSSDFKELKQLLFSKK
jgi:O-antigen/teichoic acid export membrane protein